MSKTYMFVINGEPRYYDQDFHDYMAHPDVQAAVKRYEDDEEEPPEPEG
jgi:hypothetical protein